MKCGRIGTKVFQAVKEKIVFIGRRVPLAFAKAASSGCGEVAFLVAGWGGIQASEALGLLQP